MLEKTIVVGPFQCNCRLLACPRTGDAVLVDPGDEPETLIRFLKDLKTPSGKPVTVKFLFHTHGHLDHIGATKLVKEQATPDAKIVLHKGDEVLYQSLKMQGELFGMKYDDPLPVDQYFEHEQELRVGDLKFSVLHTPGHSPGSVCIRLHEDTASGVSESLLSGDTLFQGSVGRTDLWGGDTDLMFKNIHERILALDDDIRVCPGHGPDTMIGIERRKNPFLAK